MLVAFKKLTEAVAGVVAETARRATDTTTHAMTGMGYFFGNFVPSTDDLVETFLKQSRPIFIPARCVPDGSDIDDYVVEFDVEEFIEARTNGPFVRPEIQVYAASDELTREILGERISEAFISEMEKAENESEALRAKSGESLDVARDKAANDVKAGVETTVLLTVLGVILAVLGLGFIAPILALIGVSNNIETAKSAIHLIVLEGKMKLSKLKLWPTEEDSLAREIESSHRKNESAFKDAVANLEILIDEDLQSQASRFK